MTATEHTGALFPEPEGRYVEVAVPIPVRHAFTYRVPPSLDAGVVPGSRVAVRFSGRQLPGIVLGETERPEAVSRVREIAGLLEPEPLFGEELLGFLVEAARYYMHPIGEVLRAAAPALPSDAIKRLARDGRLREGDRLPGLSLATRRTLLVRRTAASTEGVRLGPRQRELLIRVEAVREIELDELRRAIPEARAVVRALAKKGLVDTEERDVVADPFFRAEVPRDVAPELLPAQRVAVDALHAALAAREGGAFLLQGVTGSGKTEVYLHAIAEARRRDRGALLLVPEIALTPQLVARFRARFGDAIAVLHSGLRDRERDDAWRALRAGAVRIAIGARSALFAPVHDLGILVVDEEHDSSFKQEDGFRYHGRDMALLRAHRARAVCVLGTATPAIETRHLVEEGRMRLLRLDQRATPHALPSVEIVDLARHRSTPSGHPLITAPLHRAITRCLEAGDQAILFLNRRGFAPSLRCKSCGVVAECPACSVALTEHKRAGVLRCHYCDYAAPPGETCAACGARELERIGVGTEKIEDALTSVFAPARVGRLDRDTATSHGVEEVLDRLRRREIDILVGTQMVTKGHDVPGVTLVGVLLADQSLVFPDFRASERTFQLLCQVAGRAGRGDTPGQVVLQTYQPEHDAIQLAARHDYEAFYRFELGARRELGYTPFSRLVAVRVDAGDDQRARAAVETLAEVAKSHPAAVSGAVRVLGPAPAPIARLRGRFRHRLLLRGADRRSLRSVAGAIVARIEEGISPARATVDVDPVSML